ncbi:unnamed protein product [Sphagnum troendelagicum]|uniref:PH domain-containing protein n=1 Tax=Sphagnum troendelagicum TaxID=128251 RepID=A0ABP0UM05_9BRYO
MHTSIIVIPTAPQFLGFLFLSFFLREIIGPQISLKEFLAEWGAIAPTSHSDQTIAILHQSVDNVTHCVWSTVCLSPILCCKVARRWLMAQGEKALPSADNTIEQSPLASPPSTPASTRLERGGDSHEKQSLLSPQKQWGISSMWWGSPKDDRAEALQREVQSLRGEIVGAEEREATMLAQLDHVDEVLRTAQLASYFHSRTRWSPLPGEPPVDDTDVDDWLLRFLVLRGSSICFYLRATDLRPQGTILQSEIVEAGLIPNHLHHQDDPHWSAFHITTCHGLRLECSSLLKLQVDCWLSLLNGGYNAPDLSRLSPHPPLPPMNPNHKILQAQVSDSTMGQEGELFGELE